MKKLFLALAVVFTSIMMSSCILVLDGEFGGSGSDSKCVVVKNSSPDRECYISSVEYKKSSSYSGWKTVWTYSTPKEESNISFDVPSSGNYDVKISVIYPKWKNGVDYVEDFYLEDIYIGTFSNTTLYFDGEDLRRDYGF